MAPLRYGIHLPLEEAATRLIRESLAGVTSHQAKSDILTPWKEQERRKREVYSRDGVADATQRQGIFHRRFNPARPELNSRDGIAQPRNIGGSLAAMIEAQYTGRYDDSGAIFQGSTRR